MQSENADDYSEVNFHSKQETVDVIYIVRTREITLSYNYLDR